MIAVVVVVIRVAGCKGRFAGVDEKMEGLAD